MSCRRLTCEIPEDHDASCSVKRSLGICMSVRGSGFTFVSFRGLTFSSPFPFMRLHRFLPDRVYPVYTSLPPAARPARSTAAGGRAGQGRRAEEGAEGEHRGPYGAKLVHPITSPSNSFFTLWMLRSCSGVTPLS